MDKISKNLRRLRLAKNMTQEQAADALGVSAQSVSRWECGTTMPDITMLPAIARLYCVTIDDLYKEKSTAYANYAHRLGCVFEATKQPEDFLAAELEYRKLLKSEQYTTDDLRMYGINYQYMMEICMEKAEALFDRVLKQGPEADPVTYWCTWRQKIYFLHQIGRGSESINHFLPLVANGSCELNEWICLIDALEMEDRFEEAWQWAEKAAHQFSEHAMLHIYQGNLCKSLGRYEEAFTHWRKAREMEPTWMDSWYAMGFCYEEMGQYAQAAQMWEEIADDLESRGYEAEVNLPRDFAKRCKEKLHE